MIVLGLVFLMFVMLENLEPDDSNLHEVDPNPRLEPPKQLYSRWFVWVIPCHSRQSPKGSMGLVYYGIFIYMHLVDLDGQFLGIKKGKLYQSQGIFSNLYLPILGWVEITRHQPTIDPTGHGSVSHDDVPWSPCVPLGISWSLGCCSSCVW